MDDLFGEPAREREVDKIATKLPEARSTKSFESFEMLAEKVSPAVLMVMITPLKEVTRFDSDIIYTIIHSNYILVSYWSKITS